MLFCPDFWIVVVSAEPFWGRRGPAAAAGGGGLAQCRAVGG